MACCKKKSHSNVLSIIAILPDNNEKLLAGLFLLFPYYLPRSLFHSLCLLHISPLFSSNYMYSDGSMVISVFFTQMPSYGDRPLAFSMESSAPFSMRYSPKVPSGSYAMA
mmetsp:Transcript_36111/g.59428  ORF Transcript_36111/g.59428 Transcript_36111/m.59428 type:complete len:110 (+) Transcript_36111:15-344(+)